MLSPLQRQVAQIIAGLEEAEEFALAGGAALIARGDPDRNGVRYTRLRNDVERRRRRALKPRSSIEVSAGLSGARVRCVVHKVHHIAHVDKIVHLAYSDERKPSVGEKEAMSALLQVREAARQLGVHENTLRRWEQSGYIAAVRLPSGVRRFRPEDVEAVHARMFEGLAPLENRDELTPVSVTSID